MWAFGQEALVDLLQVESKELAEHVPIVGVAGEENRMRQ